MSIPIVRSAAAAAFATLLALTACGTPGGDVSVLQSDSVSVAPGSTYAWQPITSATQRSADPRVANDIIQGRLETAVDTALAAKGFRKVSSPTQATLLVAYYVGLQNRTDTRVDTVGGAPAMACGFRGCVGGWGMYGPPMTEVQNINYTEGTIILDLVDRASGKLAWRSTSQRRIDDGDGAQPILNAILADMTKSLPGPAPAGN